VLRGGLARMGGERADARRQHRGQCVVADGAGACTRRAGARARPGPRAPWLALLAGAWALRLAVYITWRHWGQPEDPGTRRFARATSRDSP
jgi:steroid 5-alpha reductase family enzyme